jgi:hypothetical protein
MKFYIALGFPIALAACGNVTEPVPALTLAASANTDTQVAHAPNPALLSGYTERPVKGPASWQELNQQQSPSQGGS